MFCYVWEYRVPADRVDGFLSGYGPGGEWDRFFGDSPDWIRTELLRDAEDPLRYVTIDYWTSRASCLEWRERHRERFDAIDARFENVTLSERHIGDFEITGPPIDPT